MVDSSDNVRRSALTEDNGTAENGDRRPAWLGVIGLLWSAAIFYHFFTTLGFVDLLKQVVGIGG
ncbi:MAG: hypothetical protein HOM68_05195 [Gemmatimonadetes bacterium]|jgi:hypothetical protein|nr:hypothetical protein [Gemmatimonadota bacterium]MBT5055917.1 hypothetical protein [Gemmatimonadota bacterium]MBT5143142.1 hypothetical protein [Gemmatimonadota bacterium]MBT5588442.1 hypothetical protein [Gemmatimonadota bacterium]MBT5964833.1 hypothetical protein [Gemmatimonadota bacterium]